MQFFRLTVVTKDQLIDAEVGFPLEHVINNVAHLDSISTKTESLSRYLLLTRSNISFLCSAPQKSLIKCLLIGETLPIHNRADIVLWQQNHRYGKIHSHTFIFPSPLENELQWFIWGFYFHQQHHWQMAFWNLPSPFTERHIGQQRVATSWKVFRYNFFLIWPYETT